MVDLKLYNLIINESHTVIGHYFPFLKHNCLDDLGDIKPKDIINQLNKDTKRIDTITSFAELRKYYKEALKKLKCH